MLDAADLAEVTQVHIAAFPDSALSRLGPALVHRHYAWRLEDASDAFLLGARDASGRLLGFVLAGSFDTSIDRFVLENIAPVLLVVARHPWRFAGKTMRSRLAMLVRLVLLRSRPTSEVRIESPPRRPATFRVLSLAVHPDIEGRGVGRRLMEATDRRARSRGVTEMGLRVHRDNARAVRFYLALGWLDDDSTAPGADLRLRRTLTP
jgi:GNAT superfamily N-acetyltransferase